ncbi:S-adenosylmethionine sensor upstream of mTORC1 [Galleria mellonella]|uniref:S-adenosylmethionine sensor upstream of mTORC1 n=1 Tax=Galleria mellonella TaxID=7137 RepID=A0A6J1X5Q4_GALME|nr:S-adenosylmethionine sensor upstream of mTORC1 [Galleria mellonella]
MASEEHKEIAEFLKNVHLSLRKSSAKIGAEKAWLEHCKNQDILKTYAHYMEKLATIHWQASSNSALTDATSRITWSADVCFDYFISKSFMKYRHKEHEIAEKLNIPFNMEESFTYPMKLIDVGSCYNPFKIYDFFDVLAIDLYPANDSVQQCDFLHVSIGNTVSINNNKVKQLKEDYFEVVTFCFLLEYIPSSKLRIKACENAYKLLKPGGLLIINTPDSKHVGANYKIMKCWRYTLSCIGFTRIKYEKSKHMHSMAFRKALCKDTAVRWAKIYKEPYMEYVIHIPQDSRKDNETVSIAATTEICLDDFMELPFFNV